MIFKVLLLCAICMSLHSCFGDVKSEIEKRSHIENTNSESYASPGKGDYTSPSGRRQIQYQGSQEQQRDLNMIDEYMRENPDF